MLTVMRGNDVGDVDLPIGRLAPHAAAGCAGISVSLVFTLVGDVIDDQRLIGSAHCRRHQTPVILTTAQPPDTGFLLLSFCMNIVVIVLPTSLFALHSSSETGRS